MGGGGRIVVVRNLSPTTLGNNNLHGRTSPYRFFFLYILSQGY